MVERTDETEQTIEASSDADDDRAESATSVDDGEETVDPVDDEQGQSMDSVEGGQPTGSDLGSIGSQQDQVAERFLELESDLSDTASSPLPDGAVRRGQITDANRIPASEVPEGYPIRIDGEQALVLTVDLVEGGEARTYLDWPQDGEPGDESMLGRLLHALEVPPEQLASLYGEQVLVEVIDGHHTVYVPAEQPRGSASNTAIATVLGASLLSLFAVFVTGGLLLSVFLVAFFALTFVVLPYLTYRDAWYLRTHSDWEGGPWFWATLAMVPGINLLSTVGYLLQRRNATFVGE